MFIGMRFGLMQVKTGLCHILSRFEVAPCKETPVPVVFDPKSILMVAKGDMFLSFKQKTF
jgi:cytochrome P450 family 6